MFRWLRFVYAEHAGDVVVIELKIGDDAELVKTLQGHQQDKAYGSDPLHDSKCKIIMTRRT